MASNRTISSRQARALVLFTVERDGKTVASTTDAKVGWKLWRRLRAGEFGDGAVLYRWSMVPQAVGRFEGTTAGYVPDTEVMK